ncbi:2TM domain-containing protein [Myroides odoratus]|uniref:Probable sensor-like histidine kinase YehU n=1 Tax=Myroides odoratus TaxID=256 RepID=A0A378RJS7_MYROD|nr:2TM domain-containing protein [Myroides odoratus]QQU02465.1 2TM domain-containing protein [Myroides odoratus]STZ26589.1 Probable sensor-like histidine kinase YehU [Myroides odoratus]
MKNNYVKLILLAFIVFILFTKVLKLHFMDLSLFLGYLVSFVGVIILVNQYWKENYWKKFTKSLDGKENSVHKVTAIVTAINFGFIWMICLALKIFDVHFIGNRTFYYFMDSSSFSAIFSTSFFFSILVYIYYYTYFTSLDKRMSINEQKVITGSVSAQFESLKNQLDPHFLFNSLNVLNALIEENPEKAQEFTSGLSKTYRYILDQKNKELVPLEEELDFAQTYIELLQMRFEESLTFEIEQEIKQEGAKVVPLSLQLLLENVIKHNKATSTKPLHIVIKQENGYLVVENNLNLRQVNEDRKGIGLTNIADRYALLTNKPIKIDQTETTFTIRIPILTKLIEPMRIIDVQENEQEILIQAKKNVEKMKKFYAHLTMYIMVNTFLIVLNLMTDARFMWSLIVVFSWGIGLVADWMKTYNYHFFLGKDWEDRKIREYMDQQNNRTNNWK